MTVSDRRLKRYFDIMMSVIGLLLVVPIIVLAWFFSAIETKSNGFFIQKRIGKDGVAFNVYKIKTMKKIDGVVTNVSTENDLRITKSGSIFRRYKVDFWDNNNKCISINSEILTNHFTQICLTYEYEKNQISFFCYPMTRVPTLLVATGTKM